MTQLLRILAALMALYMQQLGHSSSKLFPVIINTPTATPTSTDTPTATSTATLTPTATPIPTNTRPPTPTATATIRSATDPTGFDVVGVPPAQKLPSAVLIYPLVRVSSTQDTRIELMNLTAGSISVECFYVSSGTCNEIGFFLTLTANQPIAWKASTGTDGNGKRLTLPFSGDGELKCTVLAHTTDVASYNALQGRAIVSDVSVQANPPQTIGYSAIGFRRLTAGSFSGVISLDGVTYEQCPDRLHFHALTSVTSQTGADSEMVLVPCSEDLLNQAPSGALIQLSVINEAEQHFSGATTLQCFNRIRFNSNAALRRSTVGSDTAHVIVRGTDVPVIGLVIDRFIVPGGGQISASSNDPYLEGGRPATINLP